MKSKYILLILSLIGIMLGANSVLFAYDQYETPIRVQIGTSESTVKTEYGEYQILDSNGKVQGNVSEGSSVELRQGQRLLSVNGFGRFSYRGNVYRGDLYWTGKNMVNILSMEQYLYSVVMREIGGYAPSLETLKAQAVASRSYACYKLKNPRHQDYDILSGTSDQAYGGYTDENFGSDVSARVRDAVNDTKGLALYYQGNLINAIYCANAGGHTESATTVWGGDYPYMVGVPSPQDGQSFVADYGGYKVLKMPTSYVWSKTMLCSEIASDMELATGKTIGTLQDITVEHGGSGNYVTTITFTGSGGAVTLSKEKIRSILSLRSGSFDIMMGSSLSAYRTFVERLVEGEDLSLLLNPKGQYVTFIGRGFGHCVGMSQWGACVMGYRGDDYRAILDYYYNRGRGLSAETLTIEQYH